VNFPPTLPGYIMLAGRVVAQANTAQAIVVLAIIAWAISCRVAWRLHGQAGVAWAQLQWRRRNQDAVGISSHFFAIQPLTLPLACLMIRVTGRQTAPGI
jgi:hypothetical protein